MYVEVEGMRIAYSEAGQGLPLLFIHGYPLNRQLWEPQVQGLADVARVLAPDLRGHGDSQAIPGPYSMDLFADDLLAFLDAINIQQPIVICGLSMGGYATFAFYRRYPERVSAMILAATRAAADTSEAKSARLQAIDTARQQGVPAIVESMLPKILSRSTLEEKPELVDYVRRMMLRNSLEGILGDLEGMMRRPDSTPTLQKILIPVLFIQGEEDQIIPQQEAESMLSHVRRVNAHARLVVIPKAGHLPNLENPEAFNQALRQMINSLEGET